MNRGTRRLSPHPRTGLVLALAVAWLVLPDPGHGQPDVGERTQELTGEINFVGCTNAERVKIRRAMEHVVSQLFVDSAFPSCLANAILSETRGDSPEAIVDRLREPIPTRIECKVEVCGSPEPAGCAPVGISSERLTLQKANVANATVESLAGTILHEVAHNKGYNHPPNGQFRDFNFRVPNQTGRCISFGFTRGRLQRNQAPGETTLAPAGGGGGRPFERFCSGFATGGTSRARGTLHQFGLLCETGTSGTVGSAAAGGSVGRSRSCLSGELVVGVWGTANHLVNQIGLFCAPRDQIEAGRVAYVRGLGLGGEPEGLPFERRCPPGMAVKAIHGQAGARLDQLQVVCQSLDSRRRASQRRLALAGTRTGNAGGGACIGNGLLVGLYGRSGGEIDKLGGVCRSTTVDPIFGLPRIGPPEAAHIVDAVGGEGGTNFGDTCPSGTALVGLRVRSAARVGQVGGICANPGEWSASNPSPALTSTPTRGASTAGTLRTFRCPRKSFLVGFEVWGKKTVHATPTVQGLIPFCRKLSLEQVIGDPAP